MKNFTFYLLALLFLAGCYGLQAQTLKPGLYASDPNASITTYAELKNDVLVTVYAGKYETKYIKNGNSYVSESSADYITIESDSSYKIHSNGKATVVNLLLDLPKLDKKNLRAIDLPTGGTGYITQKVPFNIAGNYTFDGSANVVTQLNADGTGKFQYATEAGQAGQMFDIQWGILCNDSGQHLASYRDGVSAYTLMIYTNKWEAVGLQFAKSIGRIVINRDRFKDK
ncbi:hypothetical protein OGH69_09760 [Flavobacterium sp. MFBS3-15]|uniref:hypothetical protein n=1 Tax=Flavobacterium sp. MFBS3-15 TaxID=2989816 RepID=UPI002235E011|nr:hypothetical protein [Flavobacterium sp. MFBS3-15]MCW4469251.1 hypothetical protein [Flavobacterium sp. MFBS3-15]